MASKENAVRVFSEPAAVAVVLYGPEIAHNLAPQATELIRAFELRIA